MRRMNRDLRRQLDRTVDKSIRTIRTELAFLNEAGNPKYRLVVQSNIRWKAGKLVDRMKFWR